jgi:hypothetical protein
MDNKEPLFALTPSGDRAEGASCGHGESALPRQSFDRWLDRELRVLGRMLGAGNDDGLVALIRRHHRLGQSD